MPNEHTFELIVTIDEEVITIPDPATVTIRVGDKVKYHSRSGAVRIEWLQNVFDRPVSTSADVATVASVGLFSGQCTFERPDGRIMGWKGKGTEGKSEKGEEGAPGDPS